MIDDPVQTWIELPPPPTAPSEAAREAADAAIAALEQSETVALFGTPGSGRRTAALLAAARLGGEAYVVPALPWRAPGAMREIARRLGVPTPVELRPPMLVGLARGAMEGKTGLVILDARVRAEPALLEAIRPPSGWRTLVLAPSDETAGVPGTPIALPYPAAEPKPGDGLDAAVLAAAAYFDPWEGAPRALLATVAGAEDDEAMTAAIARLMDAGLLRPARDPRRVMPTLHAHQERPELHDPSDPTNRGRAERYVLAMATWCVRAGDEARQVLADDRANLMTALSIWQDVAPVGLVDGFARALPMLLDDVGCHEAAKVVIQATRFGDDETVARGDHARRRMDWKD